MHYEQLGLGTVLARAQACDGVGPAVELPGLGHVVDAQDEGQAACEECVSQLRVKDQVVAPSRTIVVHAAAGENVRRVSVDALVRQAERVDMPAHPGARLVRELQDGAARVERGLHLSPDPLRHLLLREVRRVPRCAAQLVHRQPVPALVARAGVPPADVDQVLVVLVAEEALAQLGQPVLSALQGAHGLLLPVVVVEVLAGGPQAQVKVVVLARTGQLPVRAREQRVGPRAAPQVQHDGTIRPRASPGAAVRGLRDLLSLSRPTCHSFFYGASYFWWAAHSPRVYLPVKAGENSFVHGFCMA